VEDKSLTWKTNHDRLFLNHLTRAEHSTREDERNKIAGSQPVHKLFVKYLELGILLGAGFFFFFFFLPRETGDEIKSQDVKNQ
jgi:hypothetical protein